MKQYFSYVGVPDPRLSSSAYPSSRDPSVACTFLCMGIVCPRKNQVTVVKLFKKFAGDRQDVVIVTAGLLSLPRLSTWSRFGSLSWASVRSGIMKSNMLTRYSIPYR